MLTPKDLQFNKDLRKYEPSQYGKIFLRNKLRSSSHLYVKSLSQHTGSVNAIEFDSKNEFLASGGDDTSIILWNIERDILVADSSSSSQSSPTRMSERHMSNIFALQFDCQSRSLISAGNDGIIFLHDLCTGQLIRGMVRTRSVLGLSSHPCNPAVLAAAFSDGRVIQYDTRAAERPPAMPILTDCLMATCVAYHPTDEHLVMAATADTGVCLVDVRQPMQLCKIVERAAARNGDSCSLNACFDSTGSSALVVGRCRCPALYSLTTPDQRDFDSASQIALFDDANYYSSCTSKSCCFAGPDDAFVATGSDSCQALLWQRPSGLDNPAIRDHAVRGRGVAQVDKACLTLTGHQSIVNQVRYCPRFGLIASSGVDLTVRVWSPFSLGPDFSGGVNPCDAPPQRQVHTHSEFLSGGVGGFLGSGAGNGPAYRSAKEKLLSAYFDSLLQKDVCSSNKSSNFSESSSSSSASSSDEEPALSG
uniref:WD_REPEATS_REGION domain-containing protein n=2 Tax=Macrostomum lignano TaxID=282301 RepID=A0A1I8I092_9PLAT